MPSVTHACTIDRCAVDMRACCQIVLYGPRKAFSDNVWNLISARFFFVVFSGLPFMLCVASPGVGTCRRPLECSVCTLCTSPTVDDVGTPSYSPPLCLNRDRINLKSCATVFGVCVFCFFKVALLLPSVDSLPPSYFIPSVVGINRLL